MAVFQLVVTKRFTYRTAPEEFSNVYHFNGTDPADQAAWDAWANKIRDIEKPIYPAGVTFVEWYGYNSGSWEIKPTSFDFRGVYAGGTVGTLVTTGYQAAPGDSAATIRFGTGQYTSRGKPIYLRKFIHPAFMDTGTSDLLATPQKTALDTYGTALINGTGLIGTARMSRPNGDLAIDRTTATYITTRTLKRRGKRPTV
jgi:hypothetical protein